MNKRPVKICMIAEKLPPEFTGSGKQVVYLSRALAAKGVQVTAVCSSIAKDNGDVLEDFPIVRLKSSRLERLRSLQFAISSMLWLFRHRERYEILHVHGYCLAAMSALLVCKLANKRTLYKTAIPGDDDPASIRNSRFGRLKTLFFKSFDGFIAVSDKVQRLIATGEFKDANVFLIPNGVATVFSYDRAEIANARTMVRQQLKLHENAKIVSFIGSIQYLKGIDLLVKAWLTVIEECPTAKLILIGPCSRSGTFYKELLNAMGLHLGKSILFIDTVKNPELYLRATDVFVFPSRNESFGNALVEAMACGTACVATKIEGVTENILTNGYNGIVVEQEDYIALARETLSVLRDDELQHFLAMNAVKTIDEKFRMERIAEQYIDLYEHLLKA